MSKVEKFEIDLEHDIDEQYQYEPGESLRGNVVIMLNGPIKIKAITIQIKGEATVSWGGEENTRNQSNFRADETYIDFSMNILESDGTDGNTCLDVGKHTFPLEYTLPMNLPSSFIGKYGSITYVVKATLKEDKKFGMSTMITSEPFLVLRRLDISQEEHLTKAQEERVEKRLWGKLAFCLSGKVTATLKLNKTGHLPGEDIFMDAEITNSSPRIVKSVQASIIMHSKFHAKTNRRENTQIVNKKRDEWEMSYGEGRRWKSVRLTIPPYIPESRLDGCDIIDILYELQFKVEVSGGKVLQITIPITVGTVQGSESVNRQGKSGSGNGFVKGGDENENEEQGLSAEAIDLNEEEAANFRYPIAPGETRNNPIFSSRH